jgi:aspartate/methionine/tyrosine aminotransferase
MLSAYIDDSESDGFASVRDVLESNRNMARETLRGTVLEYMEPVVKVSVAWFKIKDRGLTATRLCQAAYNDEVYILSGAYFLWSRRELGERYVRIALAREPKQFRNAILQLRETLNGLQCA